MPCKHVLKIREMLSCIMISSSSDKSPYENLKYFLDQHKSLKSNIYREVDVCNCESEDDIRQLRNRIRELEGNSSDELVLRRNVESDLSVVQRERDSWRSNSWSLQSANSSLQTERDGLREQVREKNELMRSGEVVLRTTQNQLTTTQNQLAIRNNEYNDLNQKFSNLQITSNNKDNEIDELKQDLGNSQNIDLRYKERKLDELVRASGLNRTRVMNLRSAYERLMKARENYNLNNINNANTEIEIIKAEFFQTNVAINDLHKIYKACEKIAELRIKQGRLHEQQAQQEVPPRR